MECSHKYAPPSLCFVEVYTGWGKGQCAVLLMCEYEMVLVLCVFGMGLESTMARQTLDVVSASACVLN